ncbi:MAG: hypothetical protein ACYS0E_15955 [Planctomycetota bacterium]|jgi:hypothetical protein
MRYWPLTAVLLAFWMGRETGAGDQPEVPKFEAIVAGQAKIGQLNVSQDVTCRTVMADRIVVRSDWRQVGASKVREVMMLSLDGLEFVTEWERKGGNSTKKRLSLNQNDGLVINGSLGVAQLDVLGAYWARRSGREPKSVVRIAAFEDDVTGASVSVFDANGNRRAVLGAIAPTNGTQSKKSPPESRVTLFDRKGNVVAQLPTK